MKTCKSCPYWVKGQNKMADGTAIGNCQVNPPTTVMSEGRSPLGQPVQNVAIQFGMSAENQWCGQHPANKAPDLKVLE